MILYHGSSVGGLSELKPFLSEHGKPYLYFASNPVVALLYAVKPVPKPFSFYPYGFDKDGTVVYSEYYENCFADIYKGKRGFLYECGNVGNVNNPTGINCAYTCENPIKPDRCVEIEDVYLKFSEYKEKGLFRIKPYDSVSEKEMSFVLDDMRQTIIKYNLKNDPENPMSNFIRNHFPTAWNE